MPDIIHRIEVKADIHAVYAALSSEQGLKGWWTTDVSMKHAAVGTVIEFRFGNGGPDMEILGLKEPNLVLWKCIAGPEDWVGTELSFSLKTSGENTVVYFAQRGWKEESEFMAHCSCKWSQFLFSLKAFLETGGGKPYPNDTALGEWG